MLSTYLLTQIFKAINLFHHLGHNESSMARMPRSDWVSQEFDGSITTGCLKTKQYHLQFYGSQHFTKHHQQYFHLLVKYTSQMIQFSNRPFLLRRGQSVSYTVWKITTSNMRMKNNKIRALVNTLTRTVKHSTAMYLLPHVFGQWKHLFPSQTF